MRGCESSTTPASMRWQSPPNTCRLSPEPSLDLPLLFLSLQCRGWCLRLLFPFVPLQVDMARLAGRPLPDIKGPKLAPFALRKSHIKFKRLISDVDAEGHGHVFEVQIHSKAYALKIVSNTPSCTILYPLADSVFVHQVQIL